MTKLETLIAELCPEGVEWGYLPQISENRDSQRRPVTKSMRTNGVYPYYGASGIVDYVDRYIFDGEYLLVSEDGANLLARNSPIAFSISGKTWVNNHAHVLEFSNCATRRFIEIYLNSISLEQYISTATQPKLTKANLNKIKIPIPPLAVQEEIVKILDNFTELTGELQEQLAAELSARKKQYEYYREKLLTFGDDVEWKKLGQIASYSKLRIPAKQVNMDAHVSVDNLLQGKMGKTSSVYVPTTGNLIKYKTYDILIGNIRPYLKKIWFSDRIGGTNGDVLVVQTHDVEKVSPRYLFHCLAADTFFDYNMQHAKGAKMPRGSKEAILNYPIPIPPLAEQERIVAILDRFDALCHDLTSGLPAEITARQKQYEYYRDKLLSFKEKEESVEG